MLEAGSLPGAAVGLDSGTDEKHWDLARSMRPGVPIFSLRDLSRLADPLGRALGEADDRRPAEGCRLPPQPDGKSFNFYVGARRHQFRLHRRRELGRQGLRARRDQLRLRRPDRRAGPSDAEIPRAARADWRPTCPPAPICPPVPDPVPAIGDPGVPDAGPGVDLGPPAAARPGRSSRGPFEILRAEPGPVLYQHDARRTQERTAGHHRSARLRDGVRRRRARRDHRSPARRERASICRPPAASAMPVLDLLVEGMGHINFAQHMIDRKGHHRPRHPRRA